MFPCTRSRRGILSGGALAFACCTTALGQTQSKCEDLEQAPAVTFDPAEEERHSIFLLLTMALVHDGWGVSRRRPEQVAVYAEAEPGRRFADYLGHNIGALMVDAKFRIICFALNRSVQLNSSLEHAEARVVRNAIRIANAAHPHKAGPLWSFGSLLAAGHLYTTLEPCSQCAGIMDLANVGSVVFAQDDPGQHHIADILYNLRHQAGSPSAPLPVRAMFLPQWNNLSAAYQRFVANASLGSRTGLTSFLETIEAYRIFRAAEALFNVMPVRHEVNAPMMLEARAFRSRWQGRIETGAAPV